MRLLFKPIVVKQLKKLPLSEKKKILRKLELLSKDPKVGKTLKGELDGLYSYKAWPYRIIYEISKGSITIFTT